ncbi:MAG: isoaspartyl peptidase/L-asparaginase family protein [Caldisericaceae bacterium]
MKAIIVHGGAGDAKKLEEVPTRVDVVKEAAYKGFEVMKNGGNSEEAVVEAVKLLENNPLFDAGRGSYLNEEGDVEMDAAIMRGDTLSIGAVAGIHRVKNPIELARKVMKDSPHNFLVGRGAEEFGKSEGIEFAPAHYFLTERVVRIWEGKYGDTVGAVAIDDEGVITAAVSTGGTENKHVGRVGDSPLVGSGFYANDSYGAVSTGIGEDIMKVILSFRIALYFPELSLEESVKNSIDDLTQAKGKAGMIALDKYGNIAFGYNTKGMFRAFIKDGMTSPVADY